MNDMITIRKFRKKDLKAIVRIQRDTYTGKYIKSNYAKRFLGALQPNQQNKPTYFVAEEDGHVRGLSAYGQAWMNWRIYEIFNVNVDPKHQRRGIGTKLMKTMIQDIKSKKGRKKRSLHDFTHDARANVLQ